LWVDRIKELVLAFPPPAKKTVGLSFFFLSDWLKKRIHSKIGGSIDFFLGKSNETTGKDRQGKSE
jgi:hypothetical protein